MTHPPSSPAERLARVLARLERLVDWERRERAAMRVSTEPARRLLALLGDPHEGFRAVHVTGSKGKGSTAALVAAGLARAGLRTGRYASPHVERMNERVVIDGREVSDDLLAEGLERALAARETLVREAPEVEPTWFDVVTAAAFWIFATEGVEWVVAEVGLGGRLDSTNVLHGVVCVVTNVELEHTAVLGSTRAAIAAEKAGILERGSTLVTAVAAASEAGVVLERVAGGLGVPVLRPPWVAGGARPGVLESNRSLAALVLDELGRRAVAGPGAQVVSAALLDPVTVARARLPGRAERFELEGTSVVLDGAHTPDSLAAVLDDLVRERSLAGRPDVVLAIGLDKDLTGFLKVLAPAVEKLFCTSVETQRQRTPEELAAAAAELGMEVETAVSPRSALDRAIASARGRWVLVVGSLYLAGALRPTLRQATP